jgi:ankyrin repeat protein
MSVKNEIILENNKKRWTAFIWACCSGHTKIVRLMISRGAAQQYLEVKPEFRSVMMGVTK